jgi:hypothetical protein
MEPTFFQSLKLAIIAASQLSRDALHVYVGLGTFLAAAFLFRRSIRSYLPLVAVLIVAMLVEAVDLRDDLITRGHTRGLASTHVLLNTLVWPTILMLLARHTRWLGGNDGTKGGRGD